MITHKNILIVKYGALGDVVRTSFFAKPLHTQSGANCSNVRVYWLTAPQSVPLLRFHPFIDIISTNPDDLSGIEFDVIYSLDDELDILSQVVQFRAREVIGANLSSVGGRIYCNLSASWFDMGLLSRYGKEHADKLKRLNRRTHSEIFKEIFQVDKVDFSFYNSENLNSNMHALMQSTAQGRIAIGLNAFAGNRWAAKALPDQEFPKLVQALSRLRIFGQSIHLFLIGSGSDLRRNQDYLQSKGVPRNITALNTDSNVLDLAAAVRSLKLLITTDSLCLHLAVAQQVPTVAFFAPTSAEEIENFPYLRKMKSLGEDYCSYKPNSDNSTITSERIIYEVNQLLERYSDD
jgi:heptosyltransferase-2